MAFSLEGAQKLLLTVQKNKSRISNLHRFVELQRATNNERVLFWLLFLAYEKTFCVLWIKFPKNNQKSQKLER